MDKQQTPEPGPEQDLPPWLSEMKREFAELTQELPPNELPKLSAAGEAQMLEKVSLERFCRDLKHSVKCQLSILEHAFSGLQSRSLREVDMSEKARSQLLQQAQSIQQMMQAQAAELTQRYRQNERQILQAVERFSAFEQELRLLHASHEELKTLLRRLQKESDEHALEVDGRQAESRSAEESARQRLAALEASQKQVAAEVSSWEERIKQAERSSWQATERKASLDREVRSLQEACEQAKAQVLQFESRLHSQEKGLQEMSEDSRKADQKSLDLIAGLDRRLQDAADSARRQTERAECSLQGSMAESEALHRAEIENLRSLVEDGRHRLEEQKTALSDTGRSLEATRSALERAEAKIAELLAQRLQQSGEGPEGVSQRLGQMEAMIQKLGSMVTQSNSRSRMDLNPFSDASGGERSGLLRPILFGLAFALAFGTVLYFLLPLAVRQREPGPSEADASGRHIKVKAIPEVTVDMEPVSVVLPVNVTTLPAKVPAPVKPKPPAPKPRGGTPGFPTHPGLAPTASTTE